jgi:hypothetical protein
VVDQYQISVDHLPNIFIFIIFEKGIMLIIVVHPIPYFFSVVIRVYYDLSQQDRHVLLPPTARVDGGAGVQYVGARVAGQVGREPDEVRV